MNSRTAVALAFAATMALAGFLLFQVQLVLAKFILPWFGGSASTWLVCLLFFQVALLAGYAHAYAITEPLPIPRQVQVQIALLGLSLLLLPITPSESWKPQDAGDPTWRILGLLAACVGVPYVALAATTPLLSRWLARTEPSLDPVRFFAASNLGSFAGLLSYPFAFERLLSSGEQTRWWSWAYALFAALFAVCGFLTMSRARGGERDDAAAPPTERGDPLLAWIAYPALGSILLLATTNAITQWSAVVPFLWVVPLSFYLLTFVITFGHPRLYRRDAFGAAFLLLAGTTLLLAPPGSSLDLLGQLALHSAALFAGCMICHGELVTLQPKPARLPRFYLAVAAGGALGGVFVALVAPLAFNDYFEHPLVLLAIAIAALAGGLRHATARKPGWAAAVLCATGLYFLSALALAAWEGISGGAVVERVRNFYGVVKIVRQNVGDPQQYSLALMQAGVDQGGQFQSAERKMQPVCGFDERSGLGLAVAHHAKRRTGGPQAPLRIGIVGLGAGMIAALGREGDTIRYYELNPAVLDLSSRHFTFMRDGKSKIDVLLGDGRLVLDRQLRANDGQSFDILVLNAFRGAAPPMHLMTKEAFDIYAAHLAEDGILAVNFELDTFEMAPLHRGMARRSRLDVRWFETTEGEGCEGPISWALYTKDRAFFDSADSQKRDLAVARRRHDRAGVDRQRQQPDEHHQLAPGMIMNLPVIPEAEALAEAVRDLPHGQRSPQIPALNNSRLQRDRLTGMTGGFIGSTVSPPASAPDRALEGHEHGAVRLEAARAHGDEALAGPALRRALGEHLAVGVDRVADEHGRRQLDLAPAEVGDGLLAHVGDAHAGDDREREAAVDQRLLELGLRGIGGIEMQRVLVHGQQREPDVVGLRDGAAGPVLVDVAHDEVIVGAADIGAKAAGGDFLGGAHVGSRQGLRRWAVRMALCSPSCGSRSDGSCRLVQEADDGRDVLAAELVLEDEPAGANIGVVQRLAQRVDGREADVHALEPSAPVREWLLAEDAAQEIDDGGLVGARPPLAQRHQIRPPEPAQQVRART